MTALLMAALIADWPQTKAEATDYRATSSHAEVVSFLKDLESRSSLIRLSSAGTSLEGRDIPLAIVSNPPVKSAAEARAMGKIVVYIQGNIHAGEVEGKEAALILLRRILKEGDPKGWLKKMVLLVSPIYNSDGNEKWGPVAVNRPEQDGPDIVGVRANGQGLDLNRDCIKAESPEMRGALETIYKPWDPDAMLDLHTTDGTRHGFDLTYSPPVNPNTPTDILRYSRDELLPAVREESRRLYGKDLFDYGNGVLGENPRWNSFDAHGRYMTNYAGLCGRIGILSEATTFIPFPDRILATDRFVTGVLDHMSRNAARIAKMRREFKLPSELGVRFALKKMREEKVPIEKLAPGEPKPLTGRPKQIEMIQMDVYSDFEATRKSRVPDWYVIPAGQSRLLRLLTRHGIKFEKVGVGRAWIKGEVFSITERKEAAQPFQRHKLVTLEGTFAPRHVTADPGEVIVSTRQRLGGLAFYILEPECEDGVAAWGYLDSPLTGDYPIRKAWDK